MEAFAANIAQVFEGVGIAFDIFGVLVICIGVLVATVRYGRLIVARQTDRAQYHRFKVEIGLALLLGLEILVAADIIKTVALEPNFTSLGVLAALVVIRTFLSWTLVLEIDGRWPWQPRPETEAPAP